MDSVITFHRIYPAAMPPMRADKSALGTLPTAAYQFCEAIRTASSFGWYIFPPSDLRLIWDGAEVLYDAEGEWRTLSSIHIDEAFPDYWDAHAPDDLKGCAPPYLSSLFVPGVVQIWSGFLVSTAEDWSVLIRPPVNLLHSQGYVCYEGLVETDRFKPCPLFVNIRLIATNREITIPSTRPLFQVQPLRRECYGDPGHSLQQVDGLEAGASALDWDGVRKTMRSADPASGDHESGSYGASVRRRSKQED